MKECVFHLVVVVYYIIFNIRVLSFSADIMRDVKPMNDNIYSVLAQLCTFWNMALQQIYFVLCLYDDVTRLSRMQPGGNRKQSDLREWITLCFTRHLVPGAIAVSVNFWIIYHINPRLLDGFSVLDNYITPWDNHALHTNIVVLVFAELYITHITYPANTKTELKAFIKLFSLYMATVGVVQPFCDIWVYPFFGLLTWYQWIAYYTANIVGACIAYLTGLLFNKVVWGDRRIEEHAPDQHTGDWRKIR